MKYLFLVIAFVSFCFSCGGSCLECHPKLLLYIDKQDHQILKECSVCHSQPSQHGGACGQDCFDCHDKSKLYADASVKEHQAIKACYDCHKDNSLVQPKSNVSSANGQKPLVELFKLNK